MYIKSLRVTSESTTRLGNRLWALTAPLVFELEGITHTIPKGFITDGASCPRILWSICAPVAGPFGLGAIVHDWVYTDGPMISRYIGDCILYTAGKNRNANWLQAYAVYYGVRLFGNSNYRTSTSLDKLTRCTCYNYDNAMTKVMTLRGNHYTDNSTMSKFTKLDN